MRTILRIGFPLQKTYYYHFTWVCWSNLTFHWFSLFPYVYQRRRLQFRPTRGKIKQINKIKLSNEPSSQFPLFSTTLEVKDLNSTFENLFSKFSLILWGVWGTITPLLVDASDCILWSAGILLVSTFVFVDML